MSHVDFALKPGMDTVFVFFAGLNQKMGVPTFDFVRSAELLDDSCIFLKDPDVHWYQQGVPGVAQDLESLGRWVRSATVQYRNIVYVGNSMGGFAALMMPALVGRGVSLAFSPQTIVNPLWLLWQRDFRWTSYQLEMFSKAGWHSEWDVLPLLKRRARGIVHFSGDDRLDSAHALRLSDVPGVSLRSHSHGDHALVKSLVENRSLSMIMQEAKVWASRS